MSQLLKLRSYQREALDAIDTSLMEYTRVACVLPTGLGKTVVFAHLIDRAHDRGQRALVLVHREELAEQARDKIHSVAPHLSVGIVKAERNEIDADVIVASVQTLANKVRRDCIEGIGIVIVDECHHAVARTWVEVLAHFGCFLQTPGSTGGPAVDFWGLQPVPAVGFTATLARTDGRGLGDVWETVAYEKDILYGIDNGFLADVRGQQVTVNGLDLATVARSRGDYQEGQLGEAMEASGAGEVITQAYWDHCFIDGNFRQGVLFAPTVDTAHSWAKQLDNAGISAATIDGTMSSEDRKLIYKRFEAGDIRVLSNCMVLCLDTETEILTDRGWTRYKEMTKAHKVANWDQGRVFFVEPREVVVRDRGADEDMYVLESPKRSIRVTRGHRMLYRTYISGQWKKAPVEELAGRALKLPTTGLAEPENPSNLTLDEAALVGFWLGDGSINRPGGGIEYTMSQSNAYPEIIRWVDDLLDRIGIDYRRYDKSHYTTPHIRWSLARGTGFGPQLRRGVQRFEDFMVKTGPRALDTLDDKQFDAFLTGLWYADGNHGAAAEGRPESGFSIYGATLSFIERVQAVATVRGWTCSLRRKTAPRDESHRQVYRLSFSRRAQHHTSDVAPEYMIRKEAAPWAPEKVWCVKTETRNIITRRRGSVTVMGNTEGWDAPWAEVAVIARPTQSPMLYTQMVGRVLRPWRGKDEALVLDVVGITSSHKLQSLTSLLKTAVLDGESLAEARLRLEREIAERVDGPKVAGVLAAKQVELFANSHSSWLQTKGGIWFLPTRDGVFFLWQIIGGKNDGAWSLGFKQSRRYSTRENGWIHEGLTLEYAMAWGEEMAEADDPTVSLKDRAWRRTKPSSAQIDYALRLKVADPETVLELRKGALSDAISIAVASKMLDGYR